MSSGTTFKALQAYATGPKGSMGRLRELSHALDTVKCEKEIDDKLNISLEWGKRGYFRHTLV